MFGDGNLRSDGCSKGEERRDETESVSSEAEGGERTEGGGDVVVKQAQVQSAKCRVSLLMHEAARKQMNAKQVPSQKEYLLSVLSKLSPLGQWVLEDEEDGVRARRG